MLVLILGYFQRVEALGLNGRLRRIAQKHFVS